MRSGQRTLLHRSSQFCKFAHFSLVQVRNRPALHSVIGPGKDIVSASGHHGWRSASTSWFGRDEQIDWVLISLVTKRGDCFPIQIIEPSADEGKTISG